MIDLFEKFLASQPRDFLVSKGLKLPNKKIKNFECGIHHQLSVIVRSTFINGKLVPKVKVPSGTKWNPAEYYNRCYLYLTDFKHLYLGKGWDKMPHEAWAVTNW